MPILSKRLFVISVLSGIVLGVCFFTYSEKRHNGEKKIAVISFENVSVSAEVSDREDSRVRGLSGRMSLSDQEGMWFDFASDGRHSFWMKEMNFPIDIIWFDKNFRAIFIKENAMPDSYPETFTPETLDRFVLEVPAGFVKKYGVVLGEKVVVHKTS